MFDWFFKKDEEADVPAEEQVVFTGTTVDLVQRFNTLEPEVQEEEIMSQMNNEADPWLNVELLKMALQIETAETQKMICYIDVGNLPKQKADTYVKDVMTEMSQKSSSVFLAAMLPYREGGPSTKVTTIPGHPTLEGILETAEKLKEFVKK